MTHDETEEGSFAGTWTGGLTIATTQAFLPTGISRIVIPPYDKTEPMTVRIRQTHRPYVVELTGKEEAGKPSKLTGETGGHTYEALAVLHPDGLDTVLLIQIKRTKKKDGRYSTDDDTGTIVAYSGHGDGNDHCTARRAS